MNSERSDGEISVILASLLQQTVRDESLELSSRSPPDQSRVVSAILVFLSEVNIFGGQMTPPNLYLSIVFDTGTLFLSNKNGTDFHFWKYKSIGWLGQRFDMRFSSSGPSDFVEVSLGSGRLKVEKIESAARSVSEACAGRCFFLPPSGIVRTETFFLGNMRRTWIESGKVLAGLENSNKFQVFADMKYILKRTKITKSTSSSLVSSSSTTGGSSSDLRTDSRSSGVTLKFLPSHQTAMMSLFSAPDIKYPALTVSQALHCTCCQHCRQTFKFTIEYLYHFALQPQCLKLVTNGASEDLYTRVNANIESNVHINHSKLVCMRTVGERRSCGSKFRTVLQYCLHIDDHRPNSNELFSCYKCSGLYFTPFSFYRHTCLVTLKRVSGVVSKEVVGGASYQNLTKPVRDNLLTCSICRTKFWNISSLVDHLRINKSQCLAKMTRGNNIQDDRLDLAGLLLTNISVEPVQCEICEELLDNQDHHEREGVSVVCRNCGVSFSSVCKHSRHSCTSETNTWCVFCQLLNTNKIPTVENVHKTEQIKMESDEDNLPKIVSVSGGVSMEETKSKLENVGGVSTKHEDSFTKTEFDKWRSYYCFDCRSPRILKRARQVRSHVKDSKHRNIAPAWKYDQVNVKIFNLKKSYKYGVLVREHLADYYSMKKKKSQKLLQQSLDGSR